MVLGASAGLRVYEELGGPAAIERHTACLIAHLYREASCLLHSNGAPLLRISGKHAEPDRWLLGGPESESVCARMTMHGLLGSQSPVAPGQADPVCIDAFYPPLSLAPTGGASRAPP